MDELEQTLNSMIREEVDLADDPDPGAIAERIVKKIARPDLEEYAEKAIRSRVVNFFAIQRYRVGLQKAPATTSARWDNVAEAHSSGALELARYAVFTGYERKWLLDCTPEDLEDAAGYHGDQARTHVHAADSYQKLAAVLKKTRGARVVGDLAETKVAGLLSA